jgi:hypothetical protein
MNPVGRKWKAVSASDKTPAMIICWLSTLSTINDVFTNTFMYHVVVSVHDNKWYYSNFGKHRYMPEMSNKLSLTAW